jgi:hypothetical protein
MDFSAEEVEQLRSLEEDLWRSETRFDESRMRRVLAPDFLEIGRSGRLFRLEDTLAVPAQQIPALLPLPSFAARLLQRDVALVTYETDVAYTWGRELARRSSLWTRTPGGWQLRFHQGTPLPEP